MSLNDTLKRVKIIDRKMAADTPSSSKKAVKARNHVALNPILKKGGIHEDHDVAAMRKKHRRKTKQKLRQTDWLSEL